MTGIELIAEERALVSIGWTSEHDDTHAESDLAFAACYYAMPFSVRVDGVMVAPSDLYPDTWESTGAKRSSDRIRNLVKAGALIAAEIDRLQRRAVAAGEG